MNPSYLDTPQGRKIAYHKTDGSGPGVVFLGGFVSDMEGTKAIHLEDWAQANDHQFIRFDYSGHGQSSGAFKEGCIGDWADDAAAVITALTNGPQILIGSSMGGWISLLMAKRMPERLAGLIGIAAAPDFTEDSMWAGFSAAQKALLQTEGAITLPSDYSDEGYLITKKLIENGRTQLVLRTPLSLPCPTRLLHGTDDADVAMSVPLKIIAHATGPDVRLTLVKGVDHRFSGPDELGMITDAVEEITERGT